jgi:D-threo-aldose 1-dehydrogenase
MSTASTSIPSASPGNAGRRRFVTRGGKTLDFTAIGFGSAPLGNYLRPLSEEDCDRTVSAAWDAGMRYFDTAPLYGLGLSEMRVGRLLASRRREDFVLSTKVGRVLTPCAKDEVNGMFFVETPQVRFDYDYSYDGVMRSFEDSLGRLGLDRVDILYVHDICGLSHGSREASEARIRELMDTGGWRALDELRANGTVMAIGAGVNEWEPCARLLELADPDLFLLAGRYTLLEQAPLDDLLPKCVAAGTSIVVGGPLNSGILAGRDTWNYRTAPPDVVERVEAIRAICDSHGVPLPAAALQFPLAHPAVVAIIPGPRNADEFRATLGLLRHPIPAALWDDLRQAKLLHPDAPTPA